MNSIVELKKISTNFSILYVEDDKVLSDETIIFLKKLFDRVDTGHNGVEGINLYMQNSYDIVITDLKMPKMNGDKMIDKIKEINPNQTIIILTAYETSKKVTELLKKNVKFILNKPINYMEFIEVLEEICTFLQAKVKR